MVAAVPAGWLRRRDAVNAVIELVDIAKTYRAGALAVHALQDVNLTIREGDLVAIVGTIGLGQVDADAHPRVSRRSDLGHVSPRR